MRLPADEVTAVDGIPVTTVPRTIFDLAAVSSVGDVEHALRESEYRRLHDLLSLPDLLARYPRRRGARAVRACLARRAEPRRPRAQPARGGLPPVPAPPRAAAAPAERLARGGRETVTRSTASGPGAGSSSSSTGFAGHGTRIAFREDRARDRRLRVAGYDVVRIAWAQLEDEPDALAGDLRRLLQ